MARHVRFYAALILLAAWFTLAMLAALEQARAQTQCGLASWYHHGTHTANGERFNPDGMTAAHNGLPFNTVVRVTRSDTGASVVVRINDTGGFARYGRVIDLARGAARALGMIEAGVVPVCITVER